MRRVIIIAALMGAILGGISLAVQHPTPFAQTYPRSYEHTFSTPALDEHLQRPHHQAVADASPLRRLGFIGDGRSHPLSSVSDFNGVDTREWTLAKWQRVLPAATALSNEIDWAALQSLIDTATGPIAIHFPSDSPRARLDRAIVVCRYSVAFYGAGNGTDVGDPAGTFLEFTAASDGFTHCADGRSKIEIHDLEIASDVPDGRNAGIRDQRANYTLLDNVAVNGFNGFCGYFDNPSFTRLRSVRCLNLQPAGTASIGAGLYYQGKNAFINHIEDTLVQGYKIGFQFHSTNTLPDVGIEDTQVLNCACGAVDICIYIDAATPDYGPFNYSFYNMSANVYSQFIVAPAFSNLLVYGGNWLLMQPVGGRVGWSAARRNLIDLGSDKAGGHMARLVDMPIGPANGPVTANSVVTAEATASDIQLRGNRLGMTLSTTAGYYQLAPGAAAVRERDTIFVNPFSPASAPPNAIAFNGNVDPSNRFELAGIGTPTLGSCGAGARLALGSTNAEGTILEGAGNVTSCTLYFAQPYRAVPPDVGLYSADGAAVTIAPLPNAVSGFKLKHAAARLTITYHARPW